MSAINIELQLLDGDVVNLPGCVRVTEDDDGGVALTFALEAGGLAEIAQRDASDVTGTMTVTGAEHNVEYNCAFERMDGVTVHFRLVCLD
ncbi:hypothetical protein BH11MYX2_BH11MYX2_07880 [soil metagenome]